MPTLNQLKKKTRAKINSIKRFGWFDGIHWRPSTKKQLVRVRKRDTHPRDYWTYFDSGLKLVSEKAFNIDLIKEISDHKKKTITNNDYTILEIGAGTGRLATETATKLPKTKIIATGVKYLPEWKKQPNSELVDWRVAHANNISRKIGENKIDFIISHFGITHASHINFALRECAKVLRKGGRIIFTTDGFSARNSVIEELRYNRDFKILSRKSSPIGFSVTVFYLEKT